MHQKLVFHLKEHSVLIHSRVLDLINEMKLKKISTEIISWTNKYLLEPLDKFIKSLENKPINFYTNKKIISQSDVGFHNSLKKNNKLFFLTLNILVGTIHINYTQILLFSLKIFLNMKMQFLLLKDYLN